MSKDMKEAKEEKILQYYLKVYEEFEDEWEERRKEQQRTIDFTQGVALGLLYGIIGNFFVQHWYSLFERVILGNFDIVFWSNLVVCGFALAIIIYATRKFQSQLKEAWRKLGIARKAKGRAKLTQEELKQRLEELKKQQG